MKTILYTKDFDEDIKESVNVILSPQFYWIKKIDIPIKRLSNAKKIAKSLFKLDDSYIYGAFKIDDEYFAYAIKKDLNLKIDKKYINGIYLAQSELYNFDKLNVSDTHSIEKVDNLLFCFPNSSNAKSFDDIKDKITLKHKIDLYTSSEDKKLIILLSILFLIINSSLFILYLNKKIAIKEIDEKKQNLIIKNHLPTTTFELDSILSNLKQEDKKQVNIRKNLEFITKTPLKKDEKFIELSYKDGFFIKIKTNRKFDNYFRKKFKIKSSLKNGVYEASLYE